MAEPGLSIGRPELLAEVGDFLGKSRDSTDWSSDDADRIAEALKSGLRRFYYPDPIPGEEKTHQWSFLEPEATFSTVVGQADYDLPDNFGSMAGNEISFPDDESQEPIRIKSYGHMKRLRQSDSDGVPHTAAIAPDSSDQSTGQRWILLLYPTPDEIWALTYPYSLNPEALSALGPYPLGGPGHAQTLIECCKWAADEIFNGGDGAQERKAREKIITSVQQDRTVTGPDIYGLVGDGDPGIPYQRIQVVTVDGVIPS